MSITVSVGEITLAVIPVGQRDSCCEALVPSCLLFTTPSIMSLMSLMSLIVTLLNWGIVDPEDEIVVWSPGVSVPCCSCLCVSLDWTSSRCFLVLVFLVGLLSGFHSWTTSRTHGLCSPITIHHGSSPPIEVPVLPLSC
ncbi:hypothetical protein DPX16_14040 [Anabarilius grahami]|uniref:Uncharacterized protein n=1 Tax=Anabarilius grahami TaxID=495550 RepID=A0A3N0Y8S8_ANAGA|nr:hypothetical protein DPX16_14040 [Anabarilius grahami]